MYRKNNPGRPKLTHFLERNDGDKNALFGNVFDICQMNLVMEEEPEPKIEPTPTMVVAVEAKKFLISASKRSKKI